MKFSSYITLLPRTTFRGDGFVDVSLNSFTNQLEFESEAKADTPTDSDSQTKVLTQINHTIYTISEILTL